MKKLLMTTIFFIATIRYTNANTGFAEERSACSKRPSMQWNVTTNRCVDSQVSVATRQKYDECLGLPTEERRAECFFNVTSSDFGKLDMKKVSMNDDMALSLQALNSTALMFNSLFGPAGKYSVCNSTVVARYTGSIATLAQLFYNLTVKKEYKKIKDDYMATVKSGDSDNDLQLRTYEFLIEEQELIKKLSSMKVTAYSIAAAGYGLATVLSVFDEANPETYVGCTTGDSGTESDTGGAEADGDYSKSSLDSAGFDSDVVSALVSKGASWNKVRASLTRPFMVGIMSGIGTTINLTLLEGAKSQKAQAENNIKALNFAKVRLADDQGKFCPNRREDLSDPYCYCYLEDKSKNQGRTNSKTCQNLWNKNERNLWADSKDAYLATKKGGRTGCISIDGNFDQNCRCKKFKNSNGQNQCLKVDFGISKIPNIDIQKPLKNLQDTIQSLSNGESSLEDFSADIFTTSAVLSRKNREKARNKLNSISSKDGKDSPQWDNKFASSAIGAIASPRLFRAIAKSSNRAKIKTNDKRIQKALKSAKIKVGLTFTNKKSSLINKKKTAKQKKMAFNLSASEARKVETFMKKKYKYKNADIVKNKNASIWKVISNRYNQTGLRRLFE